MLVRCDNDPGSRLLLSIVSAAAAVAAAQYEVTSARALQLARFRPSTLTAYYRSPLVAAGHDGEPSYTQHAQLWRRARATDHGALPHASYAAERAHADPCAALAAEPTTARGSGKSL